MIETGASQPQHGRAALESELVFADILCAVDGTRRSFAAVEQAAVLAGPKGHLTLLAVTAVTGSGAYQSAAIGPARAEGILDFAARIAHRAEVPSTVVIDPAHPPSSVILDRASRHDLLALGAPVTSRLGGMLIGGVAVDAVRLSPTPLLAARPMPDGEHGFAQRIVLASDGLDGSDQLVELVGRLAKAHNASVVLIHASDGEPDFQRHRVEEQARRLEAALDAPGEVRVEAAGAAEAIVRGAEQTAASVVVVGAHRRGGLKGLGSVSRQVLHDAHCSVLLVPPEGLPEGLQSS
jgi:nucleotide-binding universal stress UspA family protein